MNNPMLDNLSQTGQQAYNLALQVGELHLHTLDTLTSHHLGAWSDAVQKGFDRLQRLNQAKGYKEVVEVQLQAAQDLASGAVDSGRQTVEVLTGARDKYVAVWQKGLEQAAAEVKKVAPKAAV